jgi:hypothetical protein
VEGCKEGGMMLTVRERFEALCAGKTIAWDYLDNGIKKRMQIKQTDKGPLQINKGEINKDAEWRNLDDPTREYFLNWEGGGWYVYSNEYPLNIIEAYQEYKKGKTISNDRDPSTVYDNLSYSDNPYFMCMDCEDIDANWRVE